jgi:hypothetical protein
LWIWIHDESSRTLKAKKIKHRTSLSLADMMWLSLKFPRDPLTCNCRCLSKCHSCLILSQNYAVSKPKSYEILCAKMLAKLDKKKPNTGIIKGLNWATVKHMTKLPLTAKAK